MPQWALVSFIDAMPDGVIQIKKNKHTKTVARFLFDRILTFAVI